MKILRTASLGSNFTDSKKWKDKVKSSQALFLT